MADHTAFLRSLDIFQPLADDALARLAARLKERRLREGQIVFRQGEAGDAMYFVLEGRVRVVSTDPEGQPRVLAFIGAGGFFGEMALLTGDPRSTDVVAATDTTLLELRRDDFEERVASHPLVLRQLVRLLAERQAATNARLLRRQAMPGEPEAGTEARGRVFTVYSSRGGSGKTTLAVNLAVALAQQEPEDVVLLDLVLTFGHAALLLDVQPRTSLAAMEAQSIGGLDREALDRYLATHTSTLRLLPGALRPEEGENVTQEHVQQALAVLRRHFAYVVVDTASNFADTTLVALEAADRIVVVATPELTTIRDLLECQRIFTEVMRIPAQRIAYWLNHPYGVDALSRQEFETGFNRAVDGELPFGAEVAVQAALRGQPLVAAHPGHPLTQAITGLAYRLAGAPVRSSPPLNTPSRRASGPLDFLRRR